MTPILEAYVYTEGEGFGKNYFMYFIMPLADYAMSELVEKKVALSETEILKWLSHALSGKILFFYIFENVDLNIYKFI